MTKSSEKVHKPPGMEDAVITPHGPDHFNVWHGKERIGTLYHTCYGWVPLGGFIMDKGVGVAFRTPEQAATALYSGRWHWQDTVYLPTNWASVLNCEVA